MYRMLKNSLNSISNHLDGDYSGIATLYKSMSALSISLNLSGRSAELTDYTNWVGQNLRLMGVFG